MVSADFTRVVGRHRTIAPRLSVTRGYAPCKAAVPAGGTIPKATCSVLPAGLVRSRAVRRMVARAAADPIGPRNLHAQALVDILWTDSAGISLDRAISSLESAVRLADDSVVILVDLSAAYLLRAEIRQTPRDLLESAETSERALAADPGNAAAQFNLALALDRLTLNGEAERMWNAVAEREAGSGWAREARARVRELAAQAAPPAPPVTSTQDVAEYVNAWPQQALYHGWDHLLGEWGKAVLVGDSVRAAAALRLAEQMGQALARRGGDQSLADAVATVRARRADPVAVRALAGYFRDYATARAHYTRGDYPAAGRVLSTLLQAAGLPDALRAWTKLFHSGTLVYAFQFAEAADAVRPLVQQVDSVRYPSLAARARWVLAGALSRRGEAGAALPLYRQAERLYARIGEQEHRGNVQGLAGEIELRLGSAAAGYSSLLTALETLRPYRGGVWLHNTLAIMGATAGADGLIRVAARVQDEGIRVADRVGNPIYPAEAHVMRAQRLARAGDAAQARADVSTAGSLAARLPDKQREYIGTGIRLARAGMLLSEAPATAAAMLDTVVTEWGPQPSLVLPALLLRADARLARGEVKGATEDLERSVGLVRQLGQSTPGAALRASLAASARGIVDRLVMLHVSAGRPEEALAALELGRLAGTSSPRASRAPFPRQPSARSVIAYALIGDTLLAWTLRADSVHLARTRVSGSEVRRTVERARVALEVGRRREDAIRELARLYGWLIHPSRAAIGPPGTELSIVADAELAAVPFAALHDLATGKFLVEDHASRLAGTVGEVPSTPRTEPVGRVLLVANPAFPRQGYPGLESLPGAAGEVETIRVFYPRSAVLAGLQADRPAVIGGVANVDAIHFAGHAVFDEARPDRSYLLLAGQRADGRERITAEEIGTLPLRGVRLVVLSACESTGSRSTGGRGLQGLTGAFLDAGAQGVVGSLWRVDDDATRELMTEFHRSYAAHRDGTRALREAQIRILRSTDGGNPSAWAAFIYSGN
jgi:CHAT domain-containing protein